MKTNSPYEAALLAEPASLDEELPGPSPAPEAPGPLDPAAAAPVGPGEGEPGESAEPAELPESGGVDPRPQPVPVGFSSYPALVQGLAPAPLQARRPEARPAYAPLPNIPGQRRGRLLQGLFGLSLLTVFFLPWAGARSWEILQLVQGAAFARQLLLLVAGVIFLSCAVLPVPPLFRAAVGLLLSALGLCLGGIMLSPWQNLMATLAMLLLPTALLLISWQSRQSGLGPSVRTQRQLGLLGMAAVLALYIVPRESVMPLTVAVELLHYPQDEAARFLGTYLLLPLPLLGFSLVALFSEDVAVLGELLGWLLCCYGPGALLILLIDVTQAYVALAVLGYSLCGAYGLAALLQRLSLSPERGTLR